MNSIFPKIGVAAALMLVLGSLQSCSTSPNLVIHQSEALSVVLRELPAGYPPLMPYSQPSTISPDQALNILASLEYIVDSTLPFSQGQLRPVFSRRQAELLAPELSKALSMALPQEVAAFTVSDDEKPDRQTKGLAFVLNDDLHLIIEELRRPFYQGEKKPYQQQLFRWELIPRERQRYYTSRSGGKGALTNWIMTPLR